MNSDRWNARYRENDVTWTDEPAPFFIEAVGGLSPGRALDLGCGPGRNAIHLAGQGWSVTGVDFSDEAIRIARDRARRCRATVEWVTSDVLELELPRSGYQLILISYLHMPHDDLIALLGRCETAIEPGGRLVVLGHDVTNISEGTGKPNHPEVAYTPQLITGALSGCTILHAARRTRPADHGVPPPGSSGSSGAPDSGSSSPPPQIDTEVIAVRKPGDDSA